MIVTIVLLVLSPLGCWWLVNRRWGGLAAGQPRLIAWYLTAFLLPLILPYRVLEKNLLNVLDGLAGTWLISATITLIELSLLTLLITLARHRWPMARPTSLIPCWLLIGLGFGLGKITRDILLATVHPLSRFYGYSQFSTFLTGPFLVQRLLEIIFGVVAGTFLAMGRYRDVPHPAKRFAGFFLLAFLVLQLESLPRLMFQFVPLLSLFSQVYLVSLLPIMCLFSLGILWYIYRREERSDALSRETERLTSS